MGDKIPTLILASASPRRLALLERAGLTPDILHPSDVDETPRHRETPRRLSIRLAEEKAEKSKASQQLRDLTTGYYLIAADTVVGLGRRCLPKAETREVAEDCLWLLSGRSHWVYSTVVVLDPKGKSTSRCSETKVRFKRLSRDDVKTYLDSEEWRGKAGGYAIQGRAESFVRYMAGSYSGVMGLPMYETVHLLSGAGYPVQTRWAEAGPTGI
jgi:septum formation protein